MPACRGLGRLIACDLIGMGDSDKLPSSGPDRYTYAEQRSFLFALWEELGLGNDVVLVVHDWGSALGFDWAAQHPDRVQGIAYMESVVAPLSWSDYVEPRKGLFQGFRSAAGEQMVLQDNLFVETILPRSIMRTLGEAEMAHYRKPFLTPGEDRRPTLTWSRELPIEGEPPHVVKTVTGYGKYLAQSPVPKLFINVDPGALLTGRARDFCRTWPNQTEITVKGRHFVQEDSATEIGQAVAAFVRRLRIS